MLLDTLWDGWFRAAQALGVVAVVTNWRVMDANLLGACTPPAGGRWSTVNDADVAERLTAGGIDGIITDRVDTLPLKASPSSR